MARALGTSNMSIFRCYIFWILIAEWMSDIVSTNLVCTWRVSACCILWRHCTPRCPLGGPSSVHWIGAMWRASASARRCSWVGKHERQRIRGRTNFFSVASHAYQTVARPFFRTTVAKLLQLFSHSYSPLRRYGVLWWEKMFSILHTYSCGHWNDS